MKIYILHGENLPAIENRLRELVNEYKSKDFSIARYNPEAKLSIPEFLTSNSLFEEQKLYLLENIDQLMPQEMEKIMKAARTQSPIVFVFGKKLGKTILDKVPKGSQIEELKLSDNIFSFLDTFYPGNSKNVLTSLHKLLDNYPAEFILALLSRQLKDIYLLKIGKLAGKESWKIAKLSKPARYYTEQKVIKLIQLLADADIKSKSSASNLSDLLDHIVLTNLE